jgi:glycerol dehydrogenase
MKSVLITPRKYVQGRGVLSELGSYVRMLGERPLVLWGPRVKELVGAKVSACLTEAGLTLREIVFQGEATAGERARVGAVAREARADVVIGIGGGKVLDVAKGVAVDLGSKMVSCPTIASNDSPTSAASVWYDEQHNFVGFDCWPFNPDIVLVDTQVIVQGPVRSFVAGMGDALSTWVEAEAAFKSRSLNLARGHPTLAAMTLARLGYDTLMQYGCDALRDVALHLVTPSVEKVVEANVLLSGIGFESGGLATAHMIANLLSNVPECQARDLMHGEKVGFGIITQLCLDDELEVARKYEIIDFEIRLGLPVTFQELGLIDVTRERFEEIGQVCAGPGSLCTNHPFPVTAVDVVDAMIAADALGQARQQLVERWPHATNLTTN